MFVLAAWVGFSKYWINLSTGQPSGQPAIGEHWMFKSKDNGWLAIHWIQFCPVDYSHDSLHFLSKAIQIKNKKGLLSSAIFKVIFHTVQFICCDLQMIYDQSLCYLCVRAGNL
jgi:hypothetical protein